MEIDSDGIKYRLILDLMQIEFDYYAQFHGRPKTELLLDI